MSARRTPTLVLPPAEAVRGLAALAFGSGEEATPVGRSLAFLPPEALDLDLDDPDIRDFGDYELREQLGQGGMGVVYRAYQRSLDREVAVKLLAAGPWAAPSFIERFRREAQSAARLQHPNIVPIHEIGSHADLNFFSMALVRGESLAQRLDREGPLPPTEAARLVQRVAEALDYAHRLGILHLDLKPANVLVDEHGEPQVADFGLSRRLGESLDAEEGDVSGTPSYMAPEQAMGRNQLIGVATDLYGLGAILYELLTGRPPFLGATPRQTLEQLVVGTFSTPRALDPRLPADLDAICTTCLARETSQRYPSARQLVEDLGRFLEGREVSVRRLRTGQRLARWAQREPRLASAIGAAFAALLLGMLATSAQWRRAELHLSASEANAAEARENLWAARTQAGETAMAVGDGFAALRPLTANLAEMESSNHSERAAVERQRIGLLLSNAPALVDLLQLDNGESVAAVALAPDAERFAVASHDSRGGRWLRQFETASGRESWKVSTLGLTQVMPFSGNIPHGYLRYARDGRHLLVGLMQQGPFAAPTETDNMAFDTRDGRPLQPPGLASTPADIVYSHDVRIALARFRSDDSSRFPDTGQFYRVADWTPFGPRHALGAGSTGDQWLPTPDGSAWLGSSDFIGFRLFEPGSLRQLWTLDLPHEQPARAWRFDDSGRWLALGTLAGEVHRVDVRSGRRERLSPALPSTVRWLEFDGQDSLLAAGEDGTLVVWDLASGRPRSAPVPGAGLSHQWQARLDGERIFRVDAHQLLGWQLPPPAAFDNRALPALARLRSARGFWAEAFDVQSERALLLSADQSGRIARWRLPPAVLKPGSAPPLPPTRQGFDGRRLVMVQGRELRLVEVDSGTPLSPAIRHPEPIRFAELSAGGRHLVSIAGRTLRVLDPIDGQLRGPPIVLPQTPIRVDLASASQRMALTVAEHDANGLLERALLVDLDTLQQREIARALPAPLLAFALDPGGRYLLAQPRSGPSAEHGLQHIAIEGEACARLETATRAAFLDLAIDPDGAGAWVAQRLPERRVRLQRWVFPACLPDAEHVFPLGSASPLLHSLGAEVLVGRLTAEAVGRFGSASDPPVELRVVPKRTMAAMAVTMDGAMIAIPSRDAVQIIDGRGGQRVGAPLPAPIAGHDAIAKLAFAEDGRRLLGRTVRGHWLVWRLSPSTLPAIDLQRLARLLDPQGAELASDSSAASELRRSLRAAARDSDSHETPRPLGTVELPSVAGERPDPRFLPVDLGPGHNVPLNGSWPIAPGTSGDLPTLAPGPQRLLGIDWRLEGGIQLSSGGAAVALHPTHRRSAAVPLGGVRARRLHLLMLMPIPMSPQQGSHITARALLIDDRGQQASLPIWTRRDVVNHLQPERADPGARVGWLGISSTAVRTGNYSSHHTISHLYAVTLDLPPTLGTLRSLQFEVGDGDMEAPLFYAATLERAGPAQPIVEVSP